MQPTAIGRPGRRASNSTACLGDLRHDAIPRTGAQDRSTPKRSDGWPSGGWDRRESPRPSAYLRGLSASSRDRLFPPACGIVQESPKFSCCATLVLWLGRTRGIRQVDLLCGWPRPDKPAEEIHRGYCTCPIRAGWTPSVFSSASPSTSPSGCPRKHRRSIRNSLRSLNWARAKAASVLLETHLGKLFTFAGFDSISPRSEVLPPVRSAVPTHACGHLLRNLPTR